MDLKQAAKTLGILWLVVKVVLWLVTPADPRFNQKPKRIS